MFLHRSFSLPLASRCCNAHAGANCTLSTFIVIMQEARCLSVREFSAVFVDELRVSSPLFLACVDVVPMQVMLSPSGDIEDGVCGHSCLVCPWHHYKISITTGEGFYQNLDRKWVSKGKILQRVHDVEERGDGVYVRFNTFEHEVASDKYACDVSMPILGCSELKQS
jgi:hypothetical protein